MRFSSLVLSIAVAFALVACGHDRKYIDRNVAQGLLTEYAKSHPVLLPVQVSNASLEFQRITMSGTDTNLDITPEERVLAKTRLFALRCAVPNVLVGGCLSAGLELTDAGKKAARQWKHEQNTYEIPIGLFKVEQVTGIEKIPMTDNSVNVHFDCTIVPDGFGTSLPTDGSIMVVAPFPFTSGLTGARFDSKSKTCQSDLTLYDDGWRVGT